MNSNVNRVCTDHFRGGYLATEHLIRLGHKKIATITAGGEGNEYELRFAGYRAALADYDISYDDALGFTGDETFQTAYQIVMDNQKSFAGVSAVFVQNDMMAFGVKEAFGELGIRIPSDVALVGYDDVELCTMFKPHLTTIHQPKEESAALACEFLLDLIRDKSSSSKEIRVSPTLVVRQSCGANSVQ